MGVLVFGVSGRVEEVGSASFDVGVSIQKVAFLCLPLSLPMVTCVTGLFCILSLLSFCPPFWFQGHMLSWIIAWDPPQKPGFTVTQPQLPLTQTLCFRSTCYSWSSYHASSFVHTVPLARILPPSISVPTALSIMATPYSSFRTQFRYHSSWVPALIALLCLLIAPHANLRQRRSLYIIIMCSCIQLMKYEIPLEGQEWV